MADNFPERDFWKMSENYNKRMARQGAAALDGDDKELTKKEIRKWGLIAGLLSIIVSIAVTHFSDSGKEDAAALSCVVMFVIILTFWELRKQLWYWGTIAFVMFGHILLVVSIHWNFPKPFPAPGFYFVCLPDYFLVYGIVRLVEKLMKKHEGAGLQE